MPTLVDTSAWIEYFRRGNNGDKIGYLIDENLVVTNDLILAELIPSLKVRNQQKIIRLLSLITKLPLEIDWDEIIEFQFRCLKNGVSGISIPDLIIAQNAKRHHCEIYSLDNHFMLMKDVLRIRVIN